MKEGLCGGRKDHVKGVRKGERKGGRTMFQERKDYISRTIFLFPRYMLFGHGQHGNFNTKVLVPGRTTNLCLA